VTSALAGWIARLQTALYEGAVQPVVYALDFADYAEPAYEATEWFLPNPRTRQPSGSFTA
jgi:hypothetical protein